MFYPEGMDDLGQPVFDADNHYYEATDAFTRHLDPALGPRCVQWATIDGRQRCFRPLRQPPTYLLDDVWRPCHVSGVVEDRIAQKHHVTHANIVPR